jgi:hypothetical protein
MATRTACACCRGWPTSSHHDQRSVRLRNRQCALTSRSEKYSLALAAPSSVSPHIRITHPPLPRERSAPSLPSIFPPPVPVLSHYLLSPSPLPPPPPPLPPFALSALLALRGPALQQSPRPGSSLPSPASPCLWPAWLTTISPVAPIHLQHRHTHTHTHTHTLTRHIRVLLPRTYLDRTFTLAQLYKQPQAKFPSVPQSESHHASISRSSLPTSILHTSSDLHEPRQLS